MSTLIDNLLENALFLSAGVEKPAVRSLSFIEVAEVFLEAGQRDRCLETLAKSMTIIEALKLPAEKVVRMAWAGNIFAQAGNLSRSKILFQRSVLLARALVENDKIQGLIDVAGEYIEVDFKVEVLPILAEIEALLAPLENNADKSHLLSVLGDIYGEYEQPEKAKSVLERALQIASSIKDNWFRSERLVEVAQSLSELAEKERATSVLEEALKVVNRIDMANRPYFLFNIIDIHLELGNKAIALELLGTVLEIVNQDPSTFSRAGSLIQTAERYRDAGTEKKALNILSYAREVADKAESDNDTISGYTHIAGLLAELGESSAALELADKAFLLCGNLKNQRTHIYMLGDLSILYVDLQAREKASRSIARIVELIAQSDVKTLGLGEVAAELADAGEPVLALKLTANIREVEVKAHALCAISGSIIEQGLEASEEMLTEERAISIGISSQRGLF